MSLLILKSFASPLPLFDESSGGDQLVAAQQLLFVGLLENGLCLGVVAAAISTAMLTGI